MLNKRECARAYARALEAVAEHIDAYPEVYFGMHDMCPDTSFDLQVYLEHTSDGVVPKVMLRRNSVFLDQETERVLKFNW